MKLAGKRLRLGAAALLTMAGVALVAPNLVSAHNSWPAGDGGGVGITSGPLCDDGSGNGSVTLYGPSGTTFALTNGGGGWTIPGGQGYVEVTGLAAGTYRADPGNIKIDIPECGNGMDASSATAKPEPETPKKVFVCKYVGTPGVDEQLQSREQPDRR